MPESLSVGGESILVERCMGDRVIALVTFPPGAVVGQVGCHECHGTGWWGYGPEESCNGACVVCKGTGREWIAL